MLPNLNDNVNDYIEELAEIEGFGANFDLNDNVDANQIDNQQNENILPNNDFLKNIVDIELAEQDLNRLYDLYENELESMRIDLEQNYIRPSYEHVKRVSAPDFNCENWAVGKEFAKIKSPILDFAKNKSREYTKNLSEIYRNVVQIHGRLVKEIKPITDNLLAMKNREKRKVSENIQKVTKELDFLINIQEYEYGVTENDIQQKRATLFDLRMRERVLDSEIADLLRLNEVMDDCRELMYKTMDGYNRITDLFLNGNKEKETVVSVSYGGVNWSGRILSERKRNIKKYAQIIHEFFQDIRRCVLDLLNTN